MRHVTRFTGVQRKGMALLLVVFIAFASLVLLTTLMASVAPRRTAVSNELQGDRALAVADGRIDSIMNTVNTLPQLGSGSVGNQPDADELQAAIVATWQGMLNGYAVDDPASSANAANVSTHFYHTTTNTWYAVWDSEGTPDHLMSIPGDTLLGYQVGATDTTTGVLALPVKNLSTGGFETSGVIGVDAACRTNNEWFEVDSNASYNDLPTDVWTIRASAYLLSRTGVVRTLEAKAEKNASFTVPTSTTSYDYTYNWFTDVDRFRSFSDYVFLDDFDVNFGKYAEVNGPVHANGTVNMGGWAKYPVTSTQHVTDYAVDGTSGNHDGRFSPLIPKKTLSWAKDVASPRYAVDHAPAVSWLQVDKALVGATPVPVPYPLETGIQDRATYYIDGNATITFSVESGVGKITINGTKYDMPATSGLDLYVYVVGKATVKGTVLGSCVVGASGDIELGGDVLYNTPPRTTEKSDFTDKRDFLGLVAGGNVVIPYSTFVADKNLIIDASMVADGWLGTDSAEWPWHNLNTEPATAPTLVVRGSMAAGDGSHMMATTQVTGGGVRQIKGYDLRQYNFDWNLKDLGVPDGFPTTGSLKTPQRTGVTKDSMLDAGIVSSDAEWNALESQLAGANASAYLVNPLVIGGRAYYAEQTVIGSPVTTWSWTGFVTSGMYRIGWKEQIGERVAAP
jgi:hypothetical protein